MALSRLSALLLGVWLVSLAMAVALHAQELQEPSKKEQESLQKTRDLLAQVILDAKLCRAQMPLLKFIEAVQMQLPKDTKISLRIDKDAFGDRYAEVTAQPMYAPVASPKGSLQIVLDSSFARSKTRIDCRLGENEVVFTTPERALFTAVYDLRGIVENPEVAGMSGPAFRNADYFQKAALVAGASTTDFRKADLSQRAALVVAAIIEMTDPVGTKQAPGRDAFQVLDGTRLVVRAGGSRHGGIMHTIQALRRMSDLAVISQVKLYDVDDAFYTKLKNAKHVPLEELERIFLDGKQPKRDSLLDQLPKQKVIQTGAEIKLDAGREATLLSRHVVVRCLPNPKQVLQGDDTRQAVLDGVSFKAVSRISPDRRYVHLSFTEASTAVEIRKANGWTKGLSGD